MWKMIFSVIFVLCTAGMFVTPADAETYSIPFNAWPSKKGESKIHNGAINIEPETKGIVFADIFNNATFCDPKSKMICFRMETKENLDTFRFSIPASPADRKNWTYDGMTYEAEKTDLPLFGREGPYWTIDQKSNNDFNIRFLFSDEYGLVLFQGYEKKENGKLFPVFILVEPCGFGASADCKRRALRAIEQEERK